MHLDVATGGELAVALAAGVDPALLVLHGNNKSDEELEHALQVGCRPRSWSTPSTRSSASLGLLPLTRRHSPLDVLVRVTPGVEAHTHEYVMTGQEDTKFGFSVASGAARARRDAVGQPARAPTCVGVHAHIGSQIFRLDAFEREVAVLATYLEEHQLDELCVGGGLGVAYLKGERAPTITEWAATVRAACAAAGVPQAVRVTAEPGRADRRPGGPHVLPGRDCKGAARHPQLRRRRRRDERQPAARPLRQRLRGLSASRDGRASAVRGAWSSESTARPATSSSPRRAFPPT